MRSCLANFRQQMADVARGAKFRELREERHWSQETAAHEIGVSVKSVRSWEKGGPIKWSNAKKAGRAYGVDPHELTEHESVSDEEEAEPRETDDETRQILVGMQAQIRELVGGQATLLSELEKANKSLRALQGSQRRTGRRSQGSDK